jgi:adenine-specific DNA-methyltransferase
MENLLDNLESLLRKDERLVSEGGLLKNKIIELAIKLDKGLIELLLADKQMKEVFFTQTDKATIFDKDKFIRFVSNKKFLPDSYTSFKNKIGLTENDEFINEKKDVVLSWPYKDCVLEGGMTKEDQKRDEIFWNQTLAPDEISRLLDPKVFTNAKKINKKGEYKLDRFRTDENGDIKDNLIIKGNNLLTLHSLKKRFAGKVKLIYIDPPYNREADTFYNDSFKHSSWLTFMKNRLDVARDLLRNDGVIFVQCDDSEYPYLKILMDEINGLVYELTYYVQVRYAQKTLAEISNYQKLIEQVLCYKKSGFIPNRPKGEYNLDKFCWEIVELRKGKVEEIGGRKVEIFKPGQYEIKKIKPHLRALKETWASGHLLRTTAKFFAQHLVPRKSKDGLSILYKVYGIGADSLGYRYFTGPQKEKATKGKYYSGIPIEQKQRIEKGDISKDLVINNFYDMADAYGNCRLEGGVELRSGKKPEIWIKTLIDIGSQESDLILDFFMGTGTTCAVAHKMGRQYIGVEQLDYDKDSAVVRLKNVINGDQTGISKSVDWKGGGDFVYLELMKWNENFVEKIQKAKTKEDLKKLWEIMKEKAFLSYKVNVAGFDKNVKDFADLSIDNQKRFLLECLDKNHLYVNYSEVDDEEYKVSEKDKKLNEEFYENR